MTDLDKNPDAFIATYGQISFPHRDELIDILQCKTFSHFYGESDPTSQRHSSTCRHYADLYRFRVERARERVVRTEAQAELISDMEHLNRILDENPDAPCCLYNCVTEKFTYAIFTRPTERGVAGCFRLQPFVESE